MNITKNKKRNRKYNPWKWVAAIAAAALLSGATYMALNYTVVERHHLEHRQ